MKKLIITLGLTLMMAMPSMGQTKQKYGTTGDKKAKALYDEGNQLMMGASASSDAGISKLNAALDKFNAALERDPKYMEALFSAAQIYQDLGQPGNQFNYICRGVAVDSTYYVTAYYLAARALCQKERYEEALKWFDLFDRFSKVKKTRVAEDKQWRRKAYAMVEIMKHPVPFEPRYPSNHIPETPFHTYWPSLSLDEKELVVTSRVPLDTAAFHKDPSMIYRINNNEFQEDFYMMKRSSADEEWGPLQPMSNNINTTFNEGAQAMSPDGRWMFYTAGGYKDSKGSCDIYFSQRTANGWTKGINIGEPINTKAWESQPSLSADGKTLFFVRGTAGSSYHASNIYMAHITGFRSDGVPTFDKPVELGDSINTKGEESHPFLHADGKSLYFSSDTWPGMGGKDLFVSRLKPDGTWSTPKNLGYPINTRFDEEGLVVMPNGFVGYFNTTKTNGEKTKREVMMFDLYEDIRAQSVPFVRGVIYECNEKTVKDAKGNGKTEIVMSNKSIDATITLDKMPEGQTIVTSRTLPDGTFVTALPEVAEYQLSAKAKGYFFKTFNISADDIRSAANGKPLELKPQQICMSPLVKGQKIALRNIFFDTDKWDIKPESRVELDKIVQVMKDNPGIRVEISGHTDSRASVKHNQVLSENRAKSTVEYLVQHGIARNRFETVGYGLSQPCDTNETEEGRAMNRRIEARIIE